jgi:DNA-damage-inducible protein J
MPRTEMIRARVDPELKAEAEGVLEELGLNASEAIRLFYRQITLQRGLPFDVRIPNAATRKAIRDARSGQNVKPYAGAAEMFEKLGI